jgi:hypothetical protein
MLQATEVIKLILEKGKPLIGQFLIYNSLETEFRSFPVRKNPLCPLCNDEPKIKKLVDYHEVCQVNTIGASTL